METSAEVPQSLSSFHVEHGAAPELDCSDWKPSSEQHIPDSLCLSCLSTSTSSCGDLLHVKNRPGLDAPLHVSKSHDSVLLLLLDGGKPPLVFSGAGEERDLYPLSTSPKSFQE